MSGKRLETEWLKLRCMWIAADAPQDLVDNLRSAFFAGAQAMITLMSGGLAPGEEPAKDDEEFVAGLNAELEEFISDFEIRTLRAGGNA